MEPPPTPVIELDGSGLREEEILAGAVLATYRIGADDKALRENPGLFEKLRGDYPVRREFHAHTIKAVEEICRRQGWVEKGVSRDALFLRPDDEIVILEGATEIARLNYSSGFAVAGTSTTAA